MTNEYKEESGYKEEPGVPFNITDDQIEKSVFFDTKDPYWDVKGTVSIVSLGALAPPVNPNLKTGTPAQKEMAGTIVIDTKDIKEQNEKVIAGLIQEEIKKQQSAFITTNYSGVAKITIENFETGSEILNMLIYLIAQQVAGRNKLTSSTSTSPGTSTSSSISTSSTEN
ncbi:MAG: hypothetical protein LUD02_12805 [Tannerellaceae bacterium]|nr:hypothetical protein [Tannerellaceae bacterium]MCD8264915.1 hypothetical protein [Tannerellaceae bacterium]